MSRARPAGGIRNAAFLAVAALVAGACLPDVQAPGGPPGDEHDGEIDDAIAQMMADYHEAGGGSVRDRVPCGEHFDWDALIAAASGLGIEQADDIQGGGGAASGGELTRLSCTLGRMGFEVEGDGYTGEAYAPVVYVWLRRGTPGVARGLDPAITPGGREVLAGQADLYDLGGWRRPDLDDTVAVAASIGDTHAVLVAVRVQLAEVDGALRLLDAVWQDLELPGSPTDNTSAGRRWLTRVIISASHGMML